MFQLIQTKREELKNNNNKLNDQSEWVYNVTYEFIFDIIEDKMLMPSRFLE